MKTRPSFVHTIWQNITVFIRKLTRFFSTNDVFGVEEPKFVSVIVLPTSLFWFINSYIKIRSLDL
jgi:hypothetical protein